MALVEARNGAGQLQNPFLGDRAASSRTAPLTTEPLFVRFIVVGIALAFLGFFIVLPLVTVFVQAFAKGFPVYLAALSDPDALSSVRLTLIVAISS